jgi:DNA topoisomerase VI subunit A
LNLLQLCSQVCQIVGLFDLDPFGLSIYKTYKFGGKTIKNPINIKYIGIRPAQLQQYLIGIEGGQKCISASLILQCSSELTERDLKSLNGLANCSMMMELERMRECIEFLKQFEHKFELEAVYEHGFGRMIDLLESELAPKPVECEFVAIL